uniref:Phosphatidylinositol-specific phospholipase C X domain-containing protein n=1 Tax=Chromera velia CCMP2878 TaxID=1169474 RepID=A0A0G4G529_9ALVE|eukprot:Cvel_20259.t1-p1 / transcript=Cvel_20259.t1 / gene=Cvel_20259 / organism=Chromera_velia_CCMP2878 / gene_product=PI-PLC X domain-containing protein DDB_G0269228, putative / transcript_product=PI-PLC X domain-containing protein DDB_G0269228, putative / location=Cvel_scaffold1807:12800-19444(+) / protein_length=453 / sequence_SO=supercontig / SO=protein_coding / is_pseudo=false
MSDGWCPDLLEEKPRSFCKTFWVGLLKFLEATPIIGCLVSLGHAIACRFQSAEVACVWSCLGCFPGLNFWRCANVFWRCCPKGRNAYGKARFSTPDKYYDDWMGHPSHQSKTLTQLCIPGSHDSGTYDSPAQPKIPYLIIGWSKCQVWGAYQQLRTGTRFFDLRINDTKYAGDHKCKPPKKWIMNPRFWVSHTIICVPLKEFLEDIKRFLELDNTKKEVIVCSMRPDKCSFEKDSLEGILDMYVEVFGKDKLIPPSRAFEPIGSLTGEGKQLLLLSEQKKKKWPECEMIEDRGEYEDGSWGATNSDYGPEHRTNLKKWLEEKQPEMGQKKIYNLEATLTPDTNMIVHSILFMKFKPDTFFRVKDAATQANANICRGLAQDWDGLKVNVINYDFVGPHINSGIIARNFTSEGEWEQYAGMCPDCKETYTKGLRFGDPIRKGSGGAKAAWGDEKV